MIQPKLNDIDTNTIEGRLLLAAIAALTGQPSLLIKGLIVDGRNIHPDEMLQKLHELSIHMFE